MFEKIFEEIFGAEALKALDEQFDKFDNKTSEADNTNDKSYFHKIVDKYENGEHVSHLEKEIKNGQVVKDVNNVKKVEEITNTNTNKLKDAPQCECGTKCKCGEDAAHWEQDIRYYNDLVEKLQNQLVRKNNKIGSLEALLNTAEKACSEKDNEIKKLKSKLEAIKQLFS